MKKLEQEYTPEMQRAAQMAAVSPDTEFLSEVEDNLQRLQKKRDGLIEPRPSKKNR